MVGRVENRESAVASSEDPAPEEGYVVEKIIDHRIVNGVTEFFLKWKNYPADQNTWEPETHLECHDLIAEYRRNIEKGGASADDVGQAGNGVDDEPEPQNDSEAGIKNRRTSKGKRRLSWRRTKAAPKQVKKLKKERLESDEEEKEAEQGEENDEEYVVEKILDSKIIRGKKQYFVKWKDYPDEENSWVPESDLFCEELVKEYEDRVAKRKPKGRNNAGPLSKKKLNSGAVGFARGLEAKRVVGATDRDGSLKFWVEWKGCENYDLVDNKTCRSKIPSLLLDFYEKNIQFSD